MPTYTYRCAACGTVHEKVQSISSYSKTPDVPTCCGASTERYFDFEAIPAHTNPSFGDRHYDGLRAPDGSDISSRTKHREYMKRHGLTTADDFKGEWDRRFNDRIASRKGEKKDPELRTTLERELLRRV